MKNIEKISSGILKESAINLSKIEGFISSRQKGVDYQIKKILSKVKKIESLISSRGGSIEDFTWDRFGSFDKPEYSLRIEFDDNLLDSFYKTDDQANEKNKFLKDLKSISGDNYSSAYSVNVKA